MEKHARSDIADAVDKPGLKHRQWGNLSSYGSVILPDANGISFPLKNSPLFIHLTTTMKCNARCVGCINSQITLNGRNAPGGGQRIEDTDPERDARAIAELARRDEAEEVAVCFYGGEPLLVPERLGAVMENLKEYMSGRKVRYMVYTNGEKLVDALNAYPVLKRDVWLYSVSIDGQEEQHNLYRQGTALSRIEENLRGLKQSGYAGEVLMWSTLREGQSLLDCFHQFRSLQLQGLVGHWFWHWVEIDEPFEDLPGFAKSYEQDFRAVLDNYCAELDAGRLLSILHLNELILYAMTGHNRGSSACGVEKARNYDIVGGRVQTCADLPPEFCLGEINPDGSLELREQELESLVGYKDILGCSRCGIHPYCGGRCPVQALTGDPERILGYCQLMRLHVGVVLEFLPRIGIALDRAGFSLQDLYDNSAYYAQFTDVTP